MSLPKECPIGPRRKRKPNKNLEGPVVRECLELLGKCPDVIYVERRNTGAVKFQDGGFIRFGSKGAADIWCLVKIPLYELDIPHPADDLSGPHVCLSSQYMVRHIEIEVKRRDGKGRQSPDQKKFQEFCDNHDIPYILATSTNDIEEKLSEICS